MQKHITVALFCTFVKMTKIILKYRLGGVSLERSRVKFIGHLLRDDEFVTNIIEGLVLGKRGRGRPKKPFDNIFRTSSHADC